MGHQSAAAIRRASTSPGHAQGRYLKTAPILPCTACFIVFAVGAVPRSTGRAAVGACPDAGVQRARRFENRCRCRQQHDDSAEMAAVLRRSVSPCRAEWFSVFLNWCAPPRPACLSRCSWKLRRGRPSIDSASQRGSGRHIRPTTHRPAPYSTVSLALAPCPAFVLTEPRIVPRCP